MKDSPYEAQIKCTRLPGVSEGPFHVYPVFKEHDLTMSVEKAVLNALWNALIFRRICVNGTSSRNSFERPFWFLLRSIPHLPYDWRYSSLLEFYVPTISRTCDERFPTQAQWWTGKPSKPFNLVEIPHVKVLVEIVRGGTHRRKIELTCCWSPCKYYSCHRRTPCWYLRCCCWHCCCQVFLIAGSSGGFCRLFVFLDL